MSSTTAVELPRSTAARRPIGRGTRGVTSRPDCLPVAQALVADGAAGQAAPGPPPSASCPHAVAPEDDDLAALASAAGRGVATTDDDGPDAAPRRQEHSRPAARGGCDDPQTAPDAVVSPASHDEVLAVLAACDERGIAVVPFGGGT